MIFVKDMDKNIINLKAIAVISCVGVFFSIMLLFCAPSNIKRCGLTTDAFIALAIMFSQIHGLYSTAIRWNDPSMSKLKKVSLALGVLSVLTLIAGITTAFASSAIVQSLTYEPDPPYIVYRIGEAFYAAGLMVECVEYCKERDKKDAEKPKERADNR